MVLYRKENLVGVCMMLHHDEHVESDIEQFQVPRRRHRIEKVLRTTLMTTGSTTPTMERVEQIARPVGNGTMSVLSKAAHNGSIDRAVSSPTCEATITNDHLLVLKQDVTRRFHAKITYNGT